MLTDGANAPLSITIPFGTLTPGTSTTPSTVEVRFRIRSKHNSGYVLRASASFAATPTSVQAGGATVAASDIGIGLAVSPAQGVILPRSDQVSPGFAYNPGAVLALNGESPYGGRLMGQATLNDIVASPGLSVLSGPKIANTDNGNASGDYLTVIVTLGLVRQFTTPCTLSGTLTFTLERA